MDNRYRKMKEELVMTRTAVFMELIIVFTLSIFAADNWAVRTPPRGGNDPNWNAHYDSDHFSVWYSSQFSVSQSDAQTGLNLLEKTFQHHVIEKKFADQLLDRNPQYKINLCIIENGLYGGTDPEGYPGMWMGAGGLRDNWGIAHEFTHSLQGVTGGFTSHGTNYVGWFWECHANWMPHQMYPDNTHCAELYIRMANLYWGSHRCRYCNWMFLEYLKETEGFEFVNNIWDNAEADVIETMMTLGEWDEKLFGDVFADYAAKNVIWDYENGTTYRSSFSRNSGHDKWRRYTYLQELDTANNRYIVPFEFAPQRYGYNHIRLYPENGASSVTVRFRGCVQEENNNPDYRSSNQWEPSSIPEPGSDWRYSLVAVTSPSTARYSEIQRFSAGAPDVSIDVSGADEVYLVVTATPTVYARIVWDQMYYTIYRYPYMVEIQGAKPQGFEPVSASGGAHSNGGGFVASSARVASSAYVGPFARVLGGTVEGQARIEDRTIVKGGTVRDNAVVKDNAMVAGGTVSGSAVVSDNAAVWGGTVTDNGTADGCANVNRITIRDNARLGGNCYVLANVTISGSAQLLGDGEIVVNKSGGVHYGLIDNSNEGNVGNSRTSPVTEVTKPGPFEWYESVAAHYSSAERIRNFNVDILQSGNGSIRIMAGMLPGSKVQLEITDTKGRSLWHGPASGAQSNLPVSSGSIYVWRLYEGTVGGSKLLKTGTAVCVR